MATSSCKQGQCGIDRQRAAVDVATPTLITSLGGVPIAAVTAGANHSLALSRDGAAYAWGCGLDGQLGSGLARGGDCEEGVTSGALPSGLGASSSVPLLVEGPGLDEEEVVQVGDLGVQFM